ncbi:MULTISPECIES: RpoL/Rpb11 RNA polymerase subunit family protein [Fervidicoccus]|nr:RpoL/Rpb11 RNA polymerase subunit family protein [Fervidicoccus fontis]
MNRKMKYSIKQMNEKELEIVLYDEDHTFGNLMAKTLMKIDGVVMSYYRIDHPLKNEMVLYLKTDGSIKPVEALKKGIGLLKDEIRELETKIKEVQV